MRTERREREAHRAFCRFRVTGEPDAITRVFDLVAPHLCALALHLARDRATADDLVQATFLDAIDHAERFDPARPLTPWLGGILVHHARHDYRRAKRPLDPSRVATPASEPAPDREAEAREVADLVAAALDRLPPPYREVVRLRLVEGLEPAAIADELERPRETVKTQLARGLARLRRGLPAGATPALAALALGGMAGSVRAAVHAHAARRAPAAPVTPHAPDATLLAVVRPSARTLALAAAGAIGISLLGLVAFEIAQTPTREPSGSVRSAQREARPGEAAEGIEPADAERRAVEGAAHAPLTIRVRRARDHEPARGVEVAVRPHDDASWLRERRVVTDGEGVLRIERAGLPGDGPWQVRAGRGDPWQLARLGDVVDIELPRGIAVAGRVLDPEGRGIAGARLVAAPPGVPLDEAALVGTTAADGSFALHDVAPAAGFGALAAGFAPPPAIALGEADVEGLVLASPGRSAPIHGLVRGADGVGIADAAVQIGGTYPPGEIALGPPSRARTDAAGRFVCDDQGYDGIAIFARAAGFAIGRGVVERSAPGTERRAEIELARGASLTGRVTRREGGAPVAGARIEVRQDAVEPPDGVEFDGPGFARAVATTDADGRYTATAIAIGSARVLARDADGARAVAVLTFVLGERAQHEFVLGRGTPLTGALVDARGAPLADWRVRAWPLGESEPVGPPVRTDAEGRFRVPGCEEGGPYQIFVAQDRAPTGGASLAYEVVARTGAGSRIEVGDDSVATAWLACELSGPNGPLEQARFDLLRVLPDGTTFHAHCDVAGVAGRFRVGPLLPGPHAVLASTKDLGTLPLGEHEIRNRTDVDAGAHAFLTPAVLAVRVRGPDGRPAAVARLALVREGLPGGLELPLVAGAGERELQPGVWHATYAGLAGSLLCERVEIAPAARVEREVWLAPGVERRFTWSALPADRWVLRIDWANATGERVFAETRVFDRPNDRAEVLRVTPGSYRVTVRDARDRVAVTQFTVDARPESDEVIVLQVPAGQ